MAEQKWFSSRPAGEWLVELYRPMTRFGWYLRVGIQGADGKLYIARWKDGEWEFCEHERNVEPPSALFMDDFFIEKLRALVADHPKWPGDSSSHDAPAVDHLTDAIEVRDRLLMMVEREWNALVEGSK